MIRAILARGVFYWLRAPGSSADLRLDEWILAIARLLLSACYLAALLREESTSALKFFLLMYLVYSIVVILVLRSYPLLSPMVHIEFHCADILWATQLIILGHWPAMSFVLFFFVMAGTAMRWGFWEAVLTAAILCVTLAFGFYAYNTRIAQVWYYRNISEFVPEVLFFLIIVCLVGFLAEANALRSEGNFMTRAIEGIRLETGLDQALSAICAHTIRLYYPTQVLLATHDLNRNRARLYRMSRSQNVLQSVELDATQREQYLSHAPAPCIRLSVERPQHRNRFRCLLLEAGKIRKEKSRCGVHESFLTEHPFNLVLALSHVFKNEWEFRFYILDPNRYVGGIAGLRFAERSLLQVAPVIHDIFLVDRLRSRARAVASGQVARELHDGVLQSLSAINMQLEELRRQVGPELGDAAERLERIQHGIREEITGLRDFTQQLRSLEVDSGRLLSFLSGMAIKFQTEHGITTHFVCDVEEVTLRPQVCLQVVRIVQEALANVRRHSRAGEAIVYLGRKAGNWVLRITDDGCGFGFSGLRSHEELLAAGIGPAVLMERAQVIGGRVCVRSTDGDGSYVEVTFPPA
jgi:signal transduction histidine kinase